MTAPESPAPTMSRSTSFGAVERSPHLDLRPSRERRRPSRAVGLRSVPHTFFTRFLSAHSFSALLMPTEERRALRDARARARAAAAA